MQRAIQIIQNSLIRSVSFLSGLLGSFFGLFKTIFGSVGKVAGVAESKESFFLKPNERTSIGQSYSQPVAMATPAKKAEPTNASRRRPQPEMDKFRKMAKDINK